MGIKAMGNNAMDPRSDGPDRRTFLRAGALAGGGLVVGAAGGVAAGRASTPRTARSTAGGRPAVDRVPFYGVHQAGVVGAAPAQLRFLAYDLIATAGAAARTALTELLTQLSAAAAALMAGRWISPQIDAPTGLVPAGLTVTIGVGARAVQLAGRAVPPALAPLPAFAGEALDPLRSGGDLGVQICGEDPFVVASAAQALTVVTAPYARPRWNQSGFIAGPATTIGTTATPRNLMGQLDGTDNPTDARLELAVWVDDESAPWMNGGSYLVCRRIRMLLPSWRALSAGAREQVIGRTLDTGAPLTGGTEHSTPNFMALGASGQPVIAGNAHLRLTHPANNAGAAMLRRGYSYDDGIRPDGSPDAGLFFQCFQTDPHQVFVPIQRKLSQSDALSKFIQHETSAVFAVLPGASAAGQWVGEGLFA